LSQSVASAIDEPAEESFHTAIVGSATVFKAHDMAGRIAARNLFIILDLSEIFDIF
jgi:hypothetical protein